MYSSCFTKPSGPKRKGFEGQAGSQFKKLKLAPVSQPSPSRDTPCPGTHIAMALSPLCDSLSDCPNPLPSAWWWHRLQVAVASFLGVWQRWVSNPWFLGATPSSDFAPISCMQCPSGDWVSQSPVSCWCDRSRYQILGSWNCTGFSGWRIHLCSPHALVHPALGCYRHKN